MKSTPQAQPQVSPEREARVADALRENLRRRKAQQQSRQAPQSRED